MIVQQANWLTRARRAAGAKGPSQVELSDDLSAIVIVANLDTPFSDWLGGVRDWSGTGQAAAVVAQFGFITLFNPLNSGIINEVYRIAFSQDVAANWLERVMDADSAGGQVAAVPTDTRIELFDNSTSIVRVGTSAVQPGAALAHVGSTPATGPDEERHRHYVLRPGRGLALVCNTVNTVCRGTFWFRERAPESGELGLGT